MIVVDRAEYMAWCEGILLDRKADGSMVVGDQANHEKADEALADGEPVGMTVNGNLISVIQFDEEQEAYVEKEIELT